MAGVARIGEVWHGVVGLGGARQARFGLARRGGAWPGKAWQAWLGEARPG